MWYIVTQAVEKEPGDSWTCRVTVRYVSGPKVRAMIVAYVEALPGYGGVQAWSDYYDWSPGDERTVEVGAVFPPADDSHRYGFEGLVTVNGKITVLGENGEKYAEREFPGIYVVKVPSLSPTFEIGQPVWQGV